jgi:hypothetical protein
MLNRNLIDRRRAPLAALALLSFPLVAQDQPPPQMMVITTTTIKPEMRQQYEAYQKEVSAAYKKAGVASRSVWQTMLGDLTEFVSVYPIQDFGAMDGDSPVVKAVGQEKADELLRRSSPMLTSVHRGLLFARPDLSIMKEGGPQLLPYAVIVRITVVPGRDSDYDHWAKHEMLPANKQGGAAQLLVFDALFNGSTEHVVVYPIEKMAALNAGPPSWKMEGGRAAAEKMGARTNGIVADEKLTIARYRADLSY